MISEKEIQALVKGMAPIIKKYVEGCVQPLQQEIKGLTERLRNIETKGVDYRGVYQRAQTYQRGTLVTKDGSIHVALRDIQEGEQPGVSDAWQLAVKAGRDGKDLR